MAELALAALSWLALSAGACLRPSRASCPLGWVQGGVDRDGSFTCVPELVGTDMDPRAYRPAGQISGRIYCDGGTIPIQLGERGFRCAKGHYQWE